jgi:chromosome condensin MukBEF MukE localization factor
MPKKKISLNSLVKVSRDLAIKKKIMKEEFDKLELKRKAKEKTEKVKTFLDDKGITSKIKTAAEFTEEQLDIVSGSKALKLVEERILLQDKYNDILATKIDEALNRIEYLENIVKQFYKNNKG